MKFCIIPVTSLKQNCLIIWCDITYEAVLIDPGENHKKIYEQVDKNSITVKKILLTHGHVDHVAGALKFKKYYNVPIFGPSKQDAWLLNNLFVQYFALGIENNMYSGTSIIPDYWLYEGDIIQVGNEIFDVLHCPGHSPGHIVFWNRKRKFIVMGDVLFQGNIGRTDLPGGDFSMLLSSIKTKLLPLGDDIYFVPGHGNCSSIGHERLTNNFLF